MPTDCVWRARRPPYEKWKAGHCYFGKIKGYESMLSKHYLEHVAPIRRPIVVHLPDRTNPNYAFPFWIDSHPSAEPDAAWDVEVDLDSLIPGKKPRITVSPSIAAHGMYHGYLTDGVVTDDLG